MQGGENEYLHPLLCCHPFLSSTIYTKLDAITLQQQLQNSFEDQQRNLIKSTVKWFFGAIIGSALMFTVWRLSNELLGYWPMQ
ncbi:hypothetical protein PROH_05995 [Prochlorothrix hollandica PCC 9006 = CALU 1027]|uniref:Uncharacterized protein n=1 Tax=Prochlorothrix hollandica PCC 9006 = CALU 1027 TaxID=317619 RepID=A0A0M2Q1F9_PROHO|nr:hypothetical protein PROH_05995 [Prochlorothrix hollandica PCC 9006 = CALU 1027]